MKKNKIVVIGIIIAIFVIGCVDILTEPETIDLVIQYEMDNNQNQEV